MEPSDFRRFSEQDKAAFLAWLLLHGFTAQPVRAGGDYIESIDVAIPWDRVWREGEPLTARLEDCWVVVHHRVNWPDGGRPKLSEDGSMLRGGTIAVATAVPMMARPPGCVLAILDTKEQYVPPEVFWASARDRLIDLYRQISTV